MSPEKQALAVFWSHKRFWALQIVAIAAWTALALTWFWLPDSRVWGVALAALQGLAVIFGGLWLIGTALVFYRKAHTGNNLKLRSICRESLRRIPALLVWATILALALWVSLKPGAPAWIWALPTILLLPLASQVTAEGWRGLFGMVWRARYFPLAALLLAAGAYLPYKLIGWHPQLHGLTMQTASLAARFVAAFLIAVSAWLILASLLTEPAAKVRSS